MTSEVGPSFKILRRRSASSSVSKKGVDNDIFAEKCAKEGGRIKKKICATFEIKGLTPTSK